MSQFDINLNLSHELSDAAWIMAHGVSGKCRICQIANEIISDLKSSGDASLVDSDPVYRTFIDFLICFESALRQKLNPSVCTSIGRLVINSGIKLMRARANRSTPDIAKKYTAMADKYADELAQISTCQ